MRYQTVLFDLDGTIMDTSHTALACYRYAAQRLGLPLPDERDLPVLMGPPMYETATRFFGLAPARAAEFVRLAREYFDPRGMVEAILYPRVRETVERLRAAGIRTGIATTKAEDQAVETLRYWKLSDLFEQVCGVDDAAPRTKCESIAECLARLGISERSRVLFFGDAPTDAAAARDAGVDFAAALWGFGFPGGDLRGYTAVAAFHDYDELARFVLE